MAYSIGFIMPTRRETCDWSEFPEEPHDKAGVIVRKFDDDLKKQMEVLICENCLGQAVEICNEQFES